MRSMVSITILIVLVLLGLLISFMSKEPESVVAPVIIEENILEIPIGTTTEEIIETATTSTSTATSTE